METESQDRDLFTRFFNALADESGAFTVQEKLALVEKLLAQAEQDGSAPVELRSPVSKSKMIRVNINDPRVQAIQAGQEVALGDVTMGGDATVQSRLVGMSVPQKIALLVGFVVIFSLLFVGLMAVISSQRHKATPTATILPSATTTVLPPTVSPTPTVGDLPDADYSLVDAPKDNPASGPNDPVSVEFGGAAYVLNQGQVRNGEWSPVAGEWLVGTDLRRVVAVPYSGEVGQAVEGLSYGAEITLRLHSSEIVVYRLTSIERVKRSQIEWLSSLNPSLVIILYGERSGERYVLVAEAVQGCAGSDVCHTPTPTLLPDVPTATPSLTPTPTETPTPTFTPTPGMTFVAPVQNSVVVTENWSVVNAVAGLRLDVVSCTRITQIGDQKGRFVVCDVTLTAEQANVTYSGQTLAIAEYKQVETSADWWPEPVAIAGMLGDGRLVNVGDSVSGKIAGEVKKGSMGSQSDPVILWEQAGIRFVIYLEH